MNEEKDYMRQIGNVLDWWKDNPNKTKEALETFANLGSEIQDFLIKKEDVK